MRRSTAGPMDWQYDDQDGLPHARKRPHYDPSPSSPFLARPSSSNPFPNPLFAPSPSSAAQPFLFHNPPPPLAQGQGGGGAFTFDREAFNPTTAFGIPEVEMAHHAPPPPPAADAAAADGTDGEDEARKDEAAAPPPPPTLAPRPLAGGAVRREMRKRLGGAGSSAGGREVRGGGRRRGRGGYEEEDEESGGSASASGSDDDNGEGSDAADDRRPASSSLARRSRPRSSRARQPQSTTHYSLHLSQVGPSGGRGEAEAEGRPRGRRAVEHSEVPYILLGYLQFLFNLALVGLLLYLVLCFIRTVRADIRRKVDEASFEIVQEIAACSAAYVANHCAPASRVPAMHQACTAWEHCMARDPLSVGEAQVGAQTFAGVVNAFVDPISWKTMGFTLITLSFLTVLTNAALTFYRSAHRPPPPPPHPSPHPSSHYLPPHPPQQAQQHAGWLGPGQGQGQGWGEGYGPGRGHAGGGGGRGGGGEGWTALGPPGGEDGGGGAGKGKGGGGWFS